MLRRKLHSETSKTKEIVPVHLDLPLFRKSYCATCLSASVILYHVTGSCKEPIAWNTYLFCVNPKETPPPTSPGNGKPTQFLILFFSRNLAVSRDLHFDANVCEQEGHNKMLWFGQNLSERIMTHVHSHIVRGVPAIKSAICPDLKDLKMILI